MGMRRRWLCRGVMLLAVVIWGAGGCRRATLLADSFDASPGTLTARGPQHVHVGEEVEFALRVLWDTSDYVVFEFEPNALEVSEYRQGKVYAKTHRFAADTFGQPASVRATAWRMVGDRDYIFTGHWRATRAPYDSRDRKVGSAVIELVVYQAVVKFAGLGGPDRLLDWRTARLQLDKSDGSTTDVGWRDSSGSERGFSVVGPDERGRYDVYYLPLASELNRGGSTHVAFQVRDRLAADADGWLRRELELPTP
jgi:hypothetical protein